jgi:hypothetical protein
VQSRPVVAPTEEWTEVAQYKERIAEWLGRKRPLRMSKVHTLLVRDHGLEASYDVGDREEAGEPGRCRSGLLAAAG